MQDQQTHLLMLDLEVEMSAEPVVEERVFDVTRRFHLQRDPVLASIVVDDHRYVTHLADPREPLTFNHPVDVGVHRKCVTGFV